MLVGEVPEKWRKKLEEHKEMAFTCREMARLQTDLQLDGNLQQLRLAPRHKQTDRAMPASPCADRLRHYHAA
jgi:5'-3' exonuclease